MVLESVLCPTCGSHDGVKHGQSGEGKQRYKCRHSECSRCTFIREYAYRGYLPEVKQQIADMAIEFLRSVAARSHEALDQAMTDALNAVTLKDMKGWFTYRFYCS